MQNRFEAEQARLPGWRWLSPSNEDATASMPLAVLTHDKDAAAGTSRPVAPALAEAGFRVLQVEEEAEELRRSASQRPPLLTALFPCLDLIQNEQPALELVAAALGAAGDAPVDLPPVLVDYANRIGTACRMMALSGDPPKTFVGLVFAFDPPPRDVAETGASFGAVTPCLAYRYDPNAASTPEPFQKGMGLCRGLPAVSLHELSFQTPFGCGQRTDAPAVVVPPSLRHVMPFPTLDETSDAWGFHALAAYNAVVLSAPEEYWFDRPDAIEDSEVKAAVQRTRHWTDRVSARLHLQDVALDNDGVDGDEGDDGDVPLGEFMPLMLDDAAAAAAKGSPRALQFRTLAKTLRGLADADCQPESSAAAPQRGYTIGEDEEEEDAEDTRRRRAQQLYRAKDYIRYLRSAGSAELSTYAVINVAAAIQRLGVVEVEVNAVDAASVSGEDEADPPAGETVAYDAADFVGLAIERQPDDPFLWSHAGCMMTELGRHDALTIAGTPYTTRDLHLRAVQLGPERAATAMLNLGLAVKHSDPPVDIDGVPHTKLDVLLRACLMDRHDAGLAWNNFAFGLGASRVHTVNGVEYTGWGCAQRAVRLSRDNPYVWDTVAALMPAAVDEAGGLELEGHRFRRADCAVTALLLKPDYGEAWCSLANCMPYPAEAAGLSIDAGSSDLAYDAEGRRVEKAQSSAAATSAATARVRVGAELVTQLECLQRAVKLEPCLGPAWAALERYLREASHRDAAAVRVRIGNRAYGAAECAAKAAQHALDDGEFLPMNR